MPLTYRKCTGPDLETLVAISRETFVAAFEKDNNPDDFQEYIKKAFALDKLASELNNEESLFYFVYEDNLLVGYFKLNVGSAQTDVHDPDTIEIERIYVLAALQGKKIGEKMLGEIINLAQEMGKSYVWLGVWERNTKAIRFYQKHQFRKFGEHPYYIGNDKQTDWLLRLDLE